MKEKEFLIDEEKVDIVDQEGNILFQVLKTEAHEKGLLHKTVIAGVRNSKGHIMVVEQAGDRQEPGQFVNPVGGHVSAGETEEEALRREATEELGISDFEHTLIGRSIFNREVLNRIENHFFVLFEIITDEIPNLGAEAVSYKWFTKDEYKEAFKNNRKMFGESHVFVVRSFYPELLE